MGKFINTAPITIPALPKIYLNFGEPNVIVGNIALIKSVKAQYDTSIKKWCDTLEIDQNVFISFVCTESRGDKSAYNSGSGASGLTQVTSVAVREAFSRFKLVTGQDLPQEITVYVKSVAPYLLNLTQNSQVLSSANESKLKKVLLSDTQFNIICGAVVLRWTLNFLKFNNQGWIDRAILGYNQSVYGAIQQFKGKPVTTMQLYKFKSIPFETRCYLLKVLGAFGYMDLIRRNNL